MSFWNMLGSCGLVTNPSDNRSITRRKYCDWLPLPDDVSSYLVLETSSNSSSLYCSSFNCLFPHSDFVWLRKLRLETQYADPAAICSRRLLSVKWTQIAECRLAFSSRCWDLLTWRSAFWGLGGWRSLRWLPSYSSDCFPFCLRLPCCLSSSSFRLFLSRPFIRLSTFRLHFFISFSTSSVF